MSSFNARSHAVHSVATNRRDAEHLVGTLPSEAGTAADPTEYFGCNVFDDKAMRRYLLAQGIPEAVILPESRSRNTYQNMEYSRALIGQAIPGAKVVYATTNYHVFRSGVWASLAGLRAEGIGSRTRWWFWPNAFMRECVGLLQNRWREELALLAVMTAFFATLSVLLG